MFRDCKGWSLQRLGLDWVHRTSKRKGGIFLGGWIMVLPLKQKMGEKEPGRAILEVFSVEA